MKKDCGVLEENGRSPDGGRRGAVEEITAHVWRREQLHHFIPSASVSQNTVGSDVADWVEVCSATTAHRDGWSSQGEQGGQSATTPTHPTRPRSCYISQLELKPCLFVQQWLCVRLHQVFTTFPQTPSALLSCSTLKCILVALDCFIVRMKKTPGESQSCCI